MYISHLRSPASVALLLLALQTAVLGQSSLLLGGGEYEAALAAAGTRPVQTAVWKTDREPDYAQAVVYLTDDESPFKEEPAATPAPVEEPEALKESAPIEAPDKPAKTDIGELIGGIGSEIPQSGGQSCCDNACCGSSCSKCSDSCGMLAPCRFRRIGIELGGWLDQGITFNGRRSADRFNGPVTFNDRDSEYQLNQLWMFAERKVETCGHGWDIGGRVDLFYGTDTRFDTSLGLDDNWGESSRFYGLAMPQLYMDFAVNNLTMRLGHFDTIIGYEVVQAPSNFFYSHAYTMQYGEPFTHTGVLGIYEMTDRVTFKAGLDRGWDNWEDNNQDFNFLGGVELSSLDEATTLAFAVSTGAYDDAGLNNRTMYSLVLTKELTRRFSYVIQHDWGMDNNGGVSLPGGGNENGEWYGVNQYLFYKLNCRLQLGMRIEWFRDDDGTRVGGLGAPKGWTLGPDIASDQIGWAGDFYEVTLGLNWKPYENIAVRPECRWDWYQGPQDGAGNLPYDFGTRRDQFTFATDVIIGF